MKENKYDDIQFSNQYKQMARSKGGLQAAGEWSDLNFDKWNANYFIEASPLRSFLNNQTQLIGKTIDAILTMGCIFNRDGVDENDEKGYLCLDESIVIMIGNVQFEVWCYTDSRVKIGINSLTLKEKSYQPYEWRDCSNLFNEDVVGQRIVGFEVKCSSCGFYDSLGLGDPMVEITLITLAFLLKMVNALYFAGMSNTWKSLLGNSHEE